MIRTILGKVSVTPRGAHIPGITYEYLDIVTSNGTTYLSKSSENDYPVSNTTHWMVIAISANIPEIKTITNDDLNEDFHLIWAHNKNTDKWIAVVKDSVGMQIPIVIRPDITSESSRKNIIIVEFNTPIQELCTLTFVFWPEE